MRDPEMAQLTKWWCEEIWKTKYGMVAPWNGQQAKLLQGILSNAHTNFGEKAMMEVGKAMEAYVYDVDPFLAKSRHPFLFFAKNPMRWMAKPVSLQAQQSVPIVNSVEPKLEFKTVSDDELERFVASKTEAELVTLARGFSASYASMTKSMYLKMNGSTLPSRMAAKIASKLGAERARNLFLNADKIVKSIT